MAYERDAREHFLLTRHGDSEQLVACVGENNSDCPFVLMEYLLVTIFVDCL